MLEFTFQRVRALSTSLSTLSPEELERWDGMATRFARASDLFLSKYINAAVKRDGPALDGSFRDYLNRAEKLRLIDAIDVWLDLRQRLANACS